MGLQSPPSPETASTVTKGTFPLLSTFVSIDLLSGEQWDPRFDNKVKDLYYDDNHSGFHLLHVYLNSVIMLLFYLFE